ncbi:MAG: TadE/TadG family type IV pilus assembly protein [Elusimicrobiota bacterium]
MRFIKKIIKNNKGQAIVETALIMTIILMILIGSMQLFIYVFSSSLGNHVAYKANRVYSVSPEGCFRDVLTVARYFIFFKNGFMLPTSTDERIEDIEGGYQITSIYLTFKTIIFGRKIIRVFDGWLWNSHKSRSRMIKSPDSEFHNKAYPGASEF